MTKYRLAAMLRISVKEAQALINIYYAAMPAIGRTMTYLGNFGVKNGYIQTMAPFFRKRWFPDWKYRTRYIDEHIAGVREDWILASIEKEAKNQPKVYGLYKSGELREPSALWVVGILSQAS